MTVLFLLTALFFIAVLYAAVGHGGASGYLAVLLLAGFAPESLRPLVLMMNVVVTAYLLFQVNRNIWQDYSYLPALMLASVPAAFLGGSLQLDDSLYRLILGMLLIVSTFRLLFSSKDADKTIKPALTMVVMLGAVLGFLAGLTGIGGGVLLSPLLVILGWATVRQSVPVVAVFILINSLAGLLGWHFSGKALMVLDSAFVFQALAIKKKYTGSR